ncbi:hypothetical protein EJ04DRAFT_53259 [Polyplosphaeria fusca]|uniref:Coenzyme Q-binding protein COQ10 START domain-containing protein n=1 Tax=Polyplosphaeria fusca TaxID=682080 RepID=A0A9P4R7G9_9PLEO|nr:hypothetical protein EJ04DRAFT_53259 [Polyplosphaeria fusca]
MAFPSFRLFLAFTSLLLVAIAQTNLPDVPPGVFNVSARIAIQASKCAAWDVLNDLPKYSEWNPYTRSAIMVTLDNMTLTNQRPVEDARLILRVQSPPLPLPVDSKTPDNILNTQIAFENITHVQPELGRVAWKYVASEEFLDAERWQAVSDLGNGSVLYESREVFSGLAAEFLKETNQVNLQKGFDGQAQGLKLYLEEKRSSGVDNNC